MAPITHKSVRTVKLTYDESIQPGKVSPERIRFEKGEWIAFESDGYEVYVQLSPEAFRPCVFTPMTGPVEVIKEPNGTYAQAPCGFVEKGTNNHAGWPADKSYGPEVDPGY